MYYAYEYTKPKHEKGAMMLEMWFICLAIFLGI